MLTFPSALKIYLAVERVDMRKSFNGLNSDIVAVPCQAGSLAASAVRRHLALRGEALLLCSALP